MINWFNMPDEGLSNGGLFEVKELEVTENGTYEQSGEMYNKVTVNVEGGGGSSDFSTAEVTINDQSGGIISGIVISLIYVDDESDMLTINAEDMSLANGTYITPLYKGKGGAFINPEKNYVVTGNATVDEEGVITYTGDFTVTKP